MPYGVIGVTIHVAANHLMPPAALSVMTVHQGEPAHERETKYDAEIVAVNGGSVRGASDEPVVSRIRGEAGTHVKTLCGLCRKRCASSHITRLMMS